MDTSKILWSDSTRTRHFLIPDDAALPPGGFALHTLTGKQQDVDADAVAPFEVSQEAAKAWLKEQVGDVIEQAKGALLEALRPLQEPRYRPQRRRPAGTSARPAEPRAGPSPALSLFAALAEQPVERLAADPEAATRGLRHVVDELAAIVSDAVAPEAARHEAARRRTEALRTTLSLHGIPVSDRVDALPDRLRQLQRAAEESPDRRAASADALEDLAQTLEEIAGRVAARLRRAARDLRETPAPAAPKASEDDRAPRQSGAAPSKEEP